MTILNDVLRSWRCGAHHHSIIVDRSIDNMAFGNPCMEHVMQLSNVSCHSLTVDVAAAQGQSPTQGPEPDRLESLQEVRNTAWNALSTGIDNPSRGSAASIYSTMSKMAGRVASGLCGIAMLPSAHASGDGSESTALTVMSSGDGIAGGVAVARGYGAAQLTRADLAVGTVALITTTLMVCGTVFGLLRSSPSTDNPSAEPQDSLGATTISTCQNLIFETQRMHEVAFDAPLIPELQEIARWTDGLIRMVETEIAERTQAPSLESLLECIRDDLKDGGLMTLRNRLNNMRDQLRIGAFGLDDLSLKAMREKFNQAIRLANSINTKLAGGVDQINAEMDRQRRGRLPRIG